jgi:hypothetical protein
MRVIERDRRKFSKGNERSHRYHEEKDLQIL